MYRHNSEKVKGRRRNDRHALRTHLGSNMWTSEVPGHASESGPVSTKSPCATRVTHHMRREGYVPLTPWEPNDSMGVS
jgi:hypothetical protein